MQQEISKCKGKDNPDVTKFRNKIKQLKSENDSIIRALTDTAASIDEKDGTQTEHKSKYISNQTNEPLLQEKKGWMKNSTKRY